MAEYLTIVVDGERYGFHNQMIDGPLLSNIADRFVGGKISECTVDELIDGVWRLDADRTIEVRRQLDKFWKPYAEGVTVCQPAP